MTGGGRCAVCKIAGLLAVVGALNWGLVGLAGIDLVARLFGEMTGAARAVYILIGVGGVVTVLSACKLCPCTKGACETK